MKFYSYTRAITQPLTQILLNCPTPHRRDLPDMFITRPSHNPDLFTEYVSSHVTVADTAKLKSALYTQFPYPHFPHTFDTKDTLILVGYIVTPPDTPHDVV